MFLETRISACVTRVCLFEVETEDNHLASCAAHGVGVWYQGSVAQAFGMFGVKAVGQAVEKLKLWTDFEEGQVEDQPQETGRNV